MRAATPYLHIAAGLVLIAWGLEAALPFSTWRISAGLYALFFFGWEPLYTIGRYGLYLASDVAAHTRMRLKRGDH